jgi:hypothetical protein
MPTEIMARCDTADCSGSGAASDDLQAALSPQGGKATSA